MDKRIKVLALLVMLVLVVAPAMAEDGGGHGGEGHHFSWVSFFGKIFNSTVLFGGLIFFLRKPLINLMAQKVWISKPILSSGKNYSKPRPVNWKISRPG